MHGATNKGAGTQAPADPAATPVYWVLGSISVLCVLMIFVRYVRLDREDFGFMLWNLFLAWLPFIVSMAAIRFAQAKRSLAGGIVLTALGAGWLLLYPNAPYLTTDFIHLLIRSYDWDGLLVWYDLVLFLLFAWIGLLLGYLSMLHFHVIVRRYTNATVGWLFVVSMSFLGGFGVYLGRVIRLNSWDALFSPFRLIDGVLEGLNPGAFIFTCLFGILSLIIYVSLHALRK